MKKLFLICILILGTQLVFADKTTWDTNTDNTNKKPVNASNIINTNYFDWAPTGTEGKDPIEAGTYWIINFNSRDYDGVDVDYSTGMEGKDPVEAHTPFVSNPEYWDYSTGKEGKDPVEVYNPLIEGFEYRDYDDLKVGFSTGIQGKNTVDLIYVPYSAKEKNAEIERELKKVLLHTPGNTENNDSKYLKIKKVIKEKLHDLIYW